MPQLSDDDDFYVHESNSKPLGEPEEAQLTVRAVLAGLLVGTLLCFTNMYFGLQTGWVTMGSIQCAVVGFAMFQAHPQTATLGPGHASSPHPPSHPHRLNLAPAFRLRCVRGMRLWFITKDFGVACTATDPANHPGLQALPPTSAAHSVEVDELTLAPPMVCRYPAASLPGGGASVRSRMWSFRRSESRLPPCRWLVALLASSPHSRRSTLP